ncbi:MULTISPECIES: SWIM zinc finger family protein [unclassified Leptolyngbya]|uniref:SWIM zinc finger family protein n=1 Tax=unclassified Leptolyngbya TaxID=2650499 RepID=UPI001685887F|nr:MULTISPECIES: SWIM zinc finger family protein [unclassified Leptolyngbya]MBD1909297.1 SWIM zinc finger family protein [Leptolyngbya sp. FACHB-8]MBD2153527.1 SWIM zinc finger family protein [Leptolyngbya sp. FACHB-16]
MTEAGVQSNREWWAQRWVDVLESFGWVRRLARARNYAREGHVLKIEFRGYKVHALVQGTAPEPYKVVLHLDSFDDEQWGYIIESLSQQAFYTAKLLAGEMPHNIEDVFTANGLSLFPFTKFDIHSRCTCPDPANPCKHIGAVYYTLGDRFSEDPFVLFQLRGRTKEQLLSALRELRQGQSADTAEPETASTQSLPEMDLAQFWQYHHQLEPSLVVIAPNPGSETVLDLLGTLPLTPELLGTVSGVSPQVVMSYLKTIYERVSQEAVIQAMTSGS